LAPQPDAAARVEGPASDEALTPELQLAVAFNVLHRLILAGKSRSLSAEELDLVGFLVAQVASLSPSLAAVVPCETDTAVSSTPPPVAREVVDLQSDLVVSPASTPVVVDASVIVRSSPSLAVALELQASSLAESYKSKPPNLTASEVCPKGAASRCPRWSARLAAKCRGGTFKRLMPRCCLRRRLPSKMVSWRCFARPRSRSLHPRHDVTPSGRRCFAAAPPGCFSVSGRRPRSAWRVDVVTPGGCVGCRE
jgi:hypothetical protein